MIEQLLNEIWRVNATERARQRCGRYPRPQGLTGAGAVGKGFPQGEHRGIKSQETVKSKLT